MAASLSVRDEHFSMLAGHLLGHGRERVAYMLCSRAAIAEDPWDKTLDEKYFSRSVILVPDTELIESSVDRVTWPTDSFVRALRRAAVAGETLAIVHNHPDGLDAFSGQDDENESDLTTLAVNRNGPGTRLLSLVLTGDHKLVGRVWVSPALEKEFRIIRVVGTDLRLHYRGRGSGRTSRILERQARAFGLTLNEDLARLRVGVVGCGGTGSAIASLLARLGVGRLLLIDKDIVDETNLNRLHGASQADADAMRPKAEVVAAAIASLGLGIRVRSVVAWVGERACRDALKSCDVIFGCTDDSHGRLLLNRFAYFYLVPVLDMGLSIRVEHSDPPEIQSLDGRVTVLMPGHTCLLCRGVIDAGRARAEALRRENPEEFERQKAEAYVIGEADPSPAVVTFTTEIACVAINELLQRLQGYRGPGGHTSERVRLFHRSADIRSGAQPRAVCPVCATPAAWGSGDVEPFLDIVDEVE